MLFATGRQPNVDHLGLQAAGVTYHPRDGIYANKYLQTTNPNIYAVGDCIAMVDYVPNANEASKGPGF